MDLGLSGVLSSAINGIGNLVSINKANKNNLKIARETNAANAAINQSQLDYNWQMWHAQNEYNNPSAQRQRLVDAGLNPIYYGLDGNSAAAGNAFSPIAAEQASPTIPNDFSSFGNAALIKAQIDNLQADSKLKGGQTDYTRALTETSDALRSGEVSLLGATFRLNESQSNLNDKRIDEVSQNIVNLKQSCDESIQRIAESKARISNIEFDQKVREFYARLDEMVKNRQLDLFAKQVAVQMFDAQTGRINAYTNQYNSSINAYNAESNRIQANSYAGMNEFNQLDALATRGARIGALSSQANMYNAAADFQKWQTKRSQNLYSIDVIEAGARAFNSAVDAVWSPIHNQTQAAGAVLDGFK